MSDLKNNNGRKYLLALASVVIFFGISIFLLFYVSPERIIEYIGVENAYLLLFIVSIFGGFTTFNVIPYHPVLITLAVGGFNPVLLGLVAAVGVSLGDSTSYFVGYQGRKILPEDANNWFLPITHLSESRPKLFMLLCFLFSATLPMSNDFITIPSGLIKIPFWRVMIPLVLGNIVFDTTLALLAPRGIDLLQNILSLTT